MTRATKRLLLASLCFGLSAGLLYSAPADAAPSSRMACDYIPGIQLGFCSSQSECQDMCDAENPPPPATLGTCNQNCCTCEQV